ncbi:MAG: response regulator transcription factor [Anaerolineae bacterium]
MRKTRILVVDDEPRLVRFVRANLQSVAYDVITTAQGRAAINLTELKQPDLIILDVMLPDIDGFEVCRRIREFSMVPIIMLTAKADETDKVKGLDLGADDYLTKPFGAQELLARVRAVLRRTELSEGVRPQPVFACGDVKVDFVRHRVTVRGQEVRLTPTEYKLLYQLALNAGRVMLHEDLLRKVWGPAYEDEIGYLRVYISRLRRKIEKNPDRPEYVLSEPGFGYVFVRPT